MNIPAQLMTNFFFKFKSIFAQAFHHSCLACSPAPEIVSVSGEANEGRVRWDSVLHYFQLQAM